MIDFVNIFEFNYNNYQTNVTVIDNNYKLQLLFAMKKLCY